MKFTDGLWGTLTGWGSYKLYIDDPEEGEVGFVGVTDEAGMSGLLCTRIRVVNGKITEIEALITRKETAVELHASRWLYRSESRAAPCRIF